MKEVYVLRHAQLDAAGELSQEGIHCATMVGRLLPKFDMVVTAGDPATDQTARHMTDDTAHAIDLRAGISPALQDRKGYVQDFTLPPHTDFTDYLFAEEDELFRRALGQQAGSLRRLTFDMRGILSDGGRGLIVSYGLIIANMMHGRSQPDEPIAHGCGYLLGDDLSKVRFNPPLL